MNDYKFKFSFSPNGIENSDFNTFLKSLVSDLLEFCDFYDNNNKMNVTSFRLKHPGENHVKLFEDISDSVIAKATRMELSEDEKSLFSTEPRISYIIKLLKNLQNIVTLYNNDSICSINRIELNDAQKWLLNEYNHASVVYQHLAYTCNANCLFCYLKANPKNICIGKKNENCTHSELMTRVKYFNRDSNLFSQSFEIKEFFNSPFVMETLLSLREKTDDDFFFVTNGTLLEEDFVYFLSTVKPVTLIVSVIVISNEKRSDIMFNDSNHNIDDLNTTTLNSFKLLHKYKIPFIPSITAWPTIDYDNLIDTIRFLEPYSPLAIRINMLGYTDTNKPKDDVPNDFWYTFCTYLKKAEFETDIPLLPIPSQYYINEFQENVLDIRVLGTIENSPARNALKKGDVIREINGYPLTSRDQFLDALTLIDGDKNLLVERGGAQIEVTIPSEFEWKYPFVSNQYGKYNFPYGICVSESIQEKQIMQIVDALESLKNINYLEVMLIVGPLVRKSVVAYFEKLGAHHDSESSRIVFNNSSIILVNSVNYYLGGNMQIMDMCVVADIIKVITDNKTENTNMVFLPDSMFNIWGNDLLGIHKDMIEKCVKIPVKFIQSKTVPY